MAGVRGLVSKAPAGEDGPHRRAVLPQNKILRGGGMGLEELAVFQIVGVLHIPCGVVLGDVHRLETLVVGDDLLKVLYNKAHGGKDLLQLPLDYGYWVVGPRVPGDRQGHVVLLGRFYLPLLLSGPYLLYSLR